MIVLIGVVFKWLFVDGGVCRFLDWERFCGGYGVREKISPLIIGKKGLLKCIVQNCMVSCYQ